MAKKTILLGGKEFELCKAVDFYVCNHSYRTIHDCYAKPSTTKVAIYNSWSEWAKKHHVANFHVSSYNTNMFTLSGVLCTDDDMVYLLTITRNHWRATPVNHLN